MCSLSSEDRKGTTQAYEATQYLLRRKLPPSLYYKLRTFSRQYPAIFLPFSRWRWNRWREKYCPETDGAEPAAPQPIMKDSEIVIEGFPRTANTFTHVAFKMAQKRPVKIAHHTHAAAQVIAGVRKDIPTIVLIREPEAAVISYIIGGFDPGISMQQVLYDYIAFYKPISKYNQKFILAKFEDITNNYGVIIQKLNAQFKSDFGEFIHTDENVKKCFELIDEGYTESFGELKEEVVSRPVDSRKTQAKILAEEFHSESLTKLRSEAQLIYEALVKTA